MIEQALSVKVRNKNGDITHREGTTENPPDFTDLGIDLEIVEEKAVVVEGEESSTYYVHINNVRVMAYPRTGRWTQVGRGHEAQLRVSYQRARLPWVPADRDSIKKLQDAGMVCGKCAFFDANQGQKDMMTEMGAYGNAPADHWRVDVADWIAEQIQIPTIEVENCGLCRKRDGMGEESEIGGLVLPAKTPQCEMAEE